MVTLMISCLAVAFAAKVYVVKSELHA